MEAAVYGAVQIESCRICGLVVISRSREAAPPYSPGREIKTTSNVGPFNFLQHLHNTCSKRLQHILTCCPPRLRAAWAEWPIGLMMIQFSKIIFSAFSQMSAICEGQFARNHSFWLIVGAVGYVALRACLGVKFHITTTFVWMQHDSVMTIVGKWKFKAENASCNIWRIQCFSPSRQFPREPNVAAAPS